MNPTRHISASSLSGITGIRGGALLLVVGTLTFLSPIPASSQTAPAVPNVPWHPAQEKSIEEQARGLLPKELSITSTSRYSLAELIDLAEAHNPETQFAWERARERADTLGVARSELFPTLAAIALSQTIRQQAYLDTRFYRQTTQSFDIAFDLNYTIFDFGARKGRIGAAKAELLAADFAFNDVHRRLIYRVEYSYFQLLNATGQVVAARANLTNAQAVLEAAQASLKNGLATLPDVLEAKSAAARANYDLQAALGAEDIARGNLATTLGASPLHPIPVQPIDQIPIPDSMEISVEQAIDRGPAAASRSYGASRGNPLRQCADKRSASGILPCSSHACLPGSAITLRNAAELCHGVTQQVSTDKLLSAWTGRSSMAVLASTGWRKQRIALERQKLKPPQLAMRSRMESGRRIQT